MGLFLTMNRHPEEAARSAAVSKGDGRGRASFETRPSGAPQDDGIECGRVAQLYHLLTARAISTLASAVDARVKAISTKARLAPNGQFAWLRISRASVGPIIWKRGPPRRSGVA